jgi:hypothetical protein
MIDTIMPSLPAAASKLDCRHSHPDRRATCGVRSRSSIVCSTEGYGYSTFGTPRGDHGKGSAEPSAVMGVVEWDTMLDGFTDHRHYRAAQLCGFRALDFGLLGGRVPRQGSTPRRRKRGVWLRLRRGWRFRLREPGPALAGGAQITNSRLESSLFRRLLRHSRTRHGGSRVTDFGK